MMSSFDILLDLTDQYARIFGVAVTLITSELWR